MAPPQNNICRQRGAAWVEKNQLFLKGTAKNKNEGALLSSIVHHHPHLTSASRVYQVCLSAAARGDGSVTEIETAAASVLLLLLLALLLVVDVQGGRGRGV